jgi:hypothetical protein
LKFPIIPPQVNGATGFLKKQLESKKLRKFPIIPPQVNGATVESPCPRVHPYRVSNYSAPSEWGDK